MARAKRNYVNNPEFLQAIIDYKQQCKDAEESGEPNPQIPNYIGECIYQISNRLATKPNFSGYTYKEEMTFLPAGIWADKERLHPSKRIARYFMFHRFRNIS